VSELRIEYTTSKATIADLRGALDAALAREFPGGLLQRRWEGDVLHLSGPGAKGTIELVADSAGAKLVGRADLAPPASLMRGMIEQKISAVMKAAV
jgi:hypothetical protein